MKINTDYEIGQHIWMVYVFDGEIHVYDDYIDYILINKEGALYCPKIGYEELGDFEVIAYEDTDKLIKKIIELSKELKKEVE